MIHLVLPMAGMGSRFIAAGYKVPKPLIRVGEWRMFELVLANLWSPLISRVTLVCQNEVADQVDTRWLAEKLEAEVNLIVLSELTNGPATTVSLALADVSSDQSSRLIVANTDQYLDTNMSVMIREFAESGSHLIVGMEADDPKWSFVQLDEETHKVNLVREKVQISNFATCGIYMFNSEREFLVGYQQMRKAGDFTNGELYVAPVYNYLSKGSTDYVNVGKVEKVFYGLGTPEDFKNFLESSIFDKAINMTRGILS